MLDRILLLMIFIIVFIGCKQEEIEGEGYKALPSCNSVVLSTLTIHDSENIPEKISISVENAEVYTECDLESSPRRYQDDIGTNLPIYFDEGSEPIESIHITICDCDKDQSMPVSIVYDKNTEIITKYFQGCGGVEFPEYTASICLDETSDACSE